METVEGVDVPEWRQILEVEAAGLLTGANNETDRFAQMHI
jgi:hypothetical protein